MRVLKQEAFMGMDNLTDIVFLDNQDKIPSNNTIVLSEYTDTVVGWYDPGKTTRLFVAPTYGKRIIANKMSSGLFSECKNLQCIEGIEVLNTNSVVHMSCMFSGCRSLTDLDLSSFDTHNVKFMQYMFEWCTSLKNLDLSSFDTSNVRYMNNMFCHCESLQTLKTGPEFDTSNARIENMFYECPIKKHIMIK